MFGGGFSDIIFFMSVDWNYSNVRHYKNDCSAFSTVFIRLDVLVCLDENNISEDDRAIMSAAADHAAASEADIAEHDAIRDEWLDTMKPMIHKRLEWAVGKIADYDVRWTEREHGTDDDAKNDGGRTTETAKGNAAFR